jgi:LCP family protein required for cell wall assembly
MSDSGAPTPHVPNQSRLEALGQAVNAGQGAPRHRQRVKRSRGKIVLVTLATVFVLIIAAVAGDYWYINHLVHHINVPGEAKQYNNTENILLVGSTTRCGLKVQNKAYGLCSQGVTGVNSDVVMILHLNLTTNQVSILSLPRDLFVPNARVDGANKIDAALYNGPQQLVAAIQEDFGIPINHYVELNFDTFADVVNVLGGIKMYFPMEVFDAYSELYVRHPGCIQLDGTRALQVVRARHLQIRFPGDSQDYRLWPQEALSDLARIRRDHEFLKVLADAVKARGLSNPLTDQRLATSVARYLTVDQGLTTSSLLSLAEHFHGVSVASVPELTVPVVLVETGSNGYLYQGYYYGDVEFPIDPGVMQTIDRFMDLGPGINTMDGKPLPKSSTVTVSVLNGTGVPNQAQVVAAGLRRRGFVVHGLASATPFGTREETVVYHANNSAASLGAAQAVIHTIEGPAVMALGRTTAGDMVTVLTGSDVSVIAPAPRVPATTTTIKGKRDGTSTTTTIKRKHHDTSTTTTTKPVTQITVVDPAAVKRDTDLSAPTDVTQALQPWDPRSCTASGGEGP